MQAALPPAQAIRVPARFAAKCAIGARPAAGAFTNDVGQLRAA
jgi:hypothetical protein